jgi:DNA-binding NtrC family response regulator
MTAETESVQVRGRQRTVLVLDDDDHVRASIRRALSLHDFNVVEAGNAMEALDLLKAGNDPIHLILCDLVLPGLGGREAANTLLARRPDTPVLYMSGYSSPDSFRRDLERNGVPFLAKPFEIPELLSAVARVLEE